MTRDYPEYHPPMIETTDEKTGNLIRRWPDAQRDWMRYQVGKKVVQKFDFTVSYLIPLGEPKSVNHSVTEPVFLLLGYGPTLEAAQRMAKHAK